MMTDIKKYDVSRETMADLITFQNMVLEWNDKFNLISKSSASDIWNRHILDSLQLSQFITKSDKLLYDFGSGAGFPAIVLAIVAKTEFSDLKISLIESIGKKAHFLQEVQNRLDLNTTIINDRIENLNLLKADIITSRALASLDKLLSYAKPFVDKNTRLVFPKGEKWQEEVENAQKIWNFEYDRIKSLTSEKGCILYIKNIRRKQNGKNNICSK